MNERIRTTKKVLLCDRDPTLLSLYQHELSDGDYEVVGASSGIEALHRVSQEQPDMLLLEDWIAAGGNGETIGRILREDAALPIVIISGHGPLGEDFPLWLADEWVVKSSDLTELKDMIQQVLSAEARGNREGFEPRGRAEGC